MSKFRILSIFLAVGLLVGALGVGPVLAGQINVPGLDARDASYAPAVLAVAENEVEWTDANGDDVKYVKHDSDVVFYIKDDALETVSKEQVARWPAAAGYATNGQTEGFNLLTGQVAGGGGDGFTLTGLPDDEFDSVGPDAGAPVDSTGKVEADGINGGDNQTTPLSVGLYSNRWHATSTFVTFATGVVRVNAIPFGDDMGLVVATTTIDNTPADPNDDDFTTVALGGQRDFKRIHAAKMEVAAGGATSTYSTVLDPSRDLVKVLGGTGAAVAVEGIKVTFTHHKRDEHNQRALVVSTSDPEGEYVKIYEVTKVGAEMDMKADATNIFRGEVEISDDPATQGRNNNGVWVGDGDTLTVRYLDKDGDIVDEDSITVDAVAPAISGIEPAGGSNTANTSPDLQFTAIDAGSAFKAASPADNFGVWIGTEIYTSGDKKGKAKLDDAGDPMLREGGQKLGGSDYPLSYVGVTDGYRVIYTTSKSWVAEFGDARQNDKFNITVRATDEADNESTETVSIVIDTGKPTLTSAETGIGWDSAAEEEKPGVANAVKLVMSEAIRSDSVEPEDFEIDNDPAASAVVGSGDNVANASRHIYLTTEDNLDPDAKPRVEVVDDVSDLSGNEVDTTKSTSETRAKDGLGPTVTVARDTALLALKGDEVDITIGSDEGLRVTDGAIVSIQGPDGSNANLKKSASADTPRSYSLTHAVKAAAETGKYGIAVRIWDVGNNSGYSTMKATDEDVAEKNVKVAGATVTITVANGPIADRDVDDDLTDEITKIEIMNEDGDTIATTSQVTVTDVDASARTVSVTAHLPAKGEKGNQDGEATKPSLATADTAVVSYNYAGAAHTFEIDMLKPGVEIKYAGKALDEAKVSNRSPFISVEFDDDEYPGDSYKDVNLTSAMLTMGDGEPMDIEDDFKANANGRDYLWAGVSLAEGEYKLMVTGEDAAGNEASMTVTFEIIKKPATEVALNPGVNLISLPGTPATSSVEGVFGSSDVTSVLTYDPSTPTKWLAAEKAPDGSWVGNLTDVSASLGYWVTTSSFDPIKVNIVSFSAGGATLPPTHSLVPGWNLVPVTVLNLVDADGSEVSATAKAKAVDANTYFGNNWLRAITYDAQAGRFVTIGPDDDPAPMLEVGKGYFVWMTRPHTIVP